MTEILAFDFEHDGVVSYPARAYVTTRDVGEYPRARSTDPITSVAAAASVTPTASKLERRILWCFEGAPGGLTDDEMCGYMPHPHAPTVKTARSRLSRRGLLVDSGRTRPSDRGRAMVVWVRA